MRVEFNSNGQILIQARDGLESYALKCWEEKNRGAYENAIVLFAPGFLANGEVINEIIEAEINNRNELE